LGVDINGINFLLYAKEQGVDFENSITLGRQYIFPGRNDILQLAKVFAGGKYLSCFKDYSIPAGSYCEDFLRCLGAKQVDSIDKSSYEGATIVHDMNYPLCVSLKNLRANYSAVIDAGTLEHVFNYPTAMKNAMELVRDSGHIIIVTPCNNFMGHGFYQFSPEIYFSLFSEKNGFRLIDIIVTEQYEDSRWFRALEPTGTIAGRTALINHEPSYLMCIAERTDIQCPILDHFPEQKDYIVSWGAANSNVDQRIEKKQISLSLSQLSPSIAKLKKLRLLTKTVRLWRYLRSSPYAANKFTYIDKYMNTPNESIKQSLP